MFMYLALITLNLSRKMNFRQNPVMKSGSPQKYAGYSIVFYSNRAHSRQILNPLFFILRHITLKAVCSATRWKLLVDDSIYSTVWLKILMKFELIYMWAVCLFIKGRKIPQSSFFDVRQPSNFLWYNCFSSFWNIMPIFPSANALDINMIIFANRSKKKTSAPW